MSRTAARCRQWTRTGKSPGSWGRGPGQGGANDSRPPSKTGPSHAPRQTPHLWPLNTFPLSWSGWKLFSLCPGCGDRGASDQGDAVAPQSQGPQDLDWGRDGGQSQCLWRPTLVSPRPKPPTLGPGAHHSPRCRGRPGRWSRRCHHRTCDARPGPWSRPRCPRQRARTAAARPRRPPTARGGRCVGWAFRGHGRWGPWPS